MALCYRRFFHFRRFFKVLCETTWIKHIFILFTAMFLLFMYIHIMELAMFTFKTRSTENPTKLCYDIPEV